MARRAARLIGARRWRRDGIAALARWAEIAAFEAAAAAARRGALVQLGRSSITLALSLAPGC